MCEGIWGCDFARLREECVLQGEPISTCTAAPAFVLVEGVGGIDVSSTLIGGVSMAIVLCGG